MGRLSAEVDTLGAKTDEQLFSQVPVLEGPTSSKIHFTNVSNQWYVSVKGPSFTLFAS